MADSQHTIRRALSGGGSPPSRRALIAGASTAVALSGLAGSQAIAGEPDETTAFCQRWCALEEESDALWSEWASIETKLAERHNNFFTLSEVEQRTLPDGGARMLEIERNGATVSKLKDKLFLKLPHMKARTPEAVVAKLTVVSRLIFHDENPELHRMIKDSIKDLRRLHKLAS
jgi:hypothetical protein